MSELIAVWRDKVDWLDGYLSMHEPDAIGLCWCLRALPCPVATQWEPVRLDYLARLHAAEAAEAALNGDTIVLPVANWP